MAGWGIAFFCVENVSFIIKPTLYLIISPTIIFYSGRSLLGKLARAEQAFRDIVRIVK